MTFRLFREDEIPPGMVRVAAGSAEFGAGDSVALDGFWIDTYEVTNRQYKAFVDAGGYREDRFWADGDRSRRLRRHHRSPRPGRMGARRLPGGRRRPAGRRRQLVRGVGVRRVGGQEPADRLPLAARSAAEHLQRDPVVEQLRHQGARPRRHLRGNRTQRHVRHGRQRPRVVHQPQPRHALHPGRRVVGARLPLPQHRFGRSLRPTADQRLPLHADRRIAAGCLVGRDRAHGRRPPGGHRDRRRGLCPRAAELRLRRPRPRCEGRVDRRRSGVLAPRGRLGSRGIRRRAAADPPVPAQERRTAVSGGRLLPALERSLPHQQCEPQLSVRVLHPQERACPGLSDLPEHLRSPGRTSTAPTTNGT